MNVKVGIIGPEDTVELIMNVAAAEESGILFFPFSYEHYEDIKSIISNNRSRIDVWIFSGQVPYAIAKEADLLEGNGFYPELNGSSLTKVLLEMTYKDHRKPERVSFDTLEKNEIRETYDELELPFEQIYINSYKGYKSTKELVEYHQSLFKQDLVQACVTCRSSVYEKLKSRHIPVYRITPTRMAIRQTIHQSRQQGETLHFKKSQIAVQIIQVEEMNHNISQNTFSYDVYRLDLKLQEVILEYSEAIFGSLLQLGRGNFIIFSTRGEVEDKSVSHSAKLLDNLRLITKQTINVGIGYGQNALIAEQNARLGLKQAKDHGGNIVVLVDEYGLVVGPLHHPKSIAFHFRTEDKEFIEKLKQAGINISTFNKFMAIQDKVGPVSSVKISEIIGMTQRNARRILSTLEKHGLAEIIGEETPTGKGRPRKIYRIAMAP